MMRRVVAAVLFALPADAVRVTVTTKLHEDLEDASVLADDPCNKVPKKYCKPDAAVFQKKRKKFNFVPKDVTCVRRYYTGSSGGNMTRCVTDEDEEDEPEPITEAETLAEPAARLKPEPESIDQEEPSLPPDVLELVQEEDEQEKAMAACAEVADKYCKPNKEAFEKKRWKKYPDVPFAFTCVREYEIVNGGKKKKCVAQALEAVEKDDGPVPESKEDDEPEPESLPDHFELEPEPEAEEEEEEEELEPEPEEEDDEEEDLKAVAMAECAKVEKKFCKTSINTFEKKRKNKYPDVPSTFTCIRDYQIVNGGKKGFCVAMSKKEVYK